MDVELVRQLGTFGVLLLAVGLMAFASRRRRRAGAIGLGLVMQGALLLAAAGGLRMTVNAEWLLLVVVATGVLTALGASAGLGREGSEDVTERAEQQRGSDVVVVEAELVEQQPTVAPGVREVTDG